MGLQQEVHCSSETDSGEEKKEYQVHIASMFKQVTRSGICVIAAKTG
jgi:hypothetical protein